MMMTDKNVFSNAVCGGNNEKKIDVNMVGNNDDFNVNITATA